MGGEQTGPESGEDALLEHSAANTACVRATAAHDMARTCVAVLPAHGIGSAADAALKQAREEVTWAVGRVQTVGAYRSSGLDGAREFLRQLSLTILYRLPERLIDDAQLRNVRDDPLPAWVDPRDAPSRLRVLDESQPVPYQAPDIELVVDEPVPRLT